METYLSYLEDTYQFCESAKLLESGEDEKEHFVILDRTIFYPQGGGQPTDTGHIEINDLIIPINAVKYEQGTVKHYTDANYASLVGKDGVCNIDSEKRLLHAKLHTAGHLISNIVEENYPRWKAVKGHHYPGESYVLFELKEDVVKDISVTLINKAILQAINENMTTIAAQISKQEAETLGMAIPELGGTLDKPIRTHKIGNFPSAPCGGTHVKQLIELAGLEITKYKIKKSSLKIKYDLR